MVFRVTGRHALLIFVAFFGAIIAANIAFMVAAVKTFPGEEEHKSYFQGVHYNEALAARAAQKALGWRAVLVDVARAGDGASFLLKFVDRSGKPLNGLTLDGGIRRATHESEDSPIKWSPEGEGAYRGRVGDAGPGLWEFRVRAVNAENEPFEMQARIVLK